MTTIKHIDIIVLSFPVAHYISDWRPVTRTYHLIVFLLTDSGFIGVGEGTPYGSSIAETYAKALSLAKAIRGLTLEDALNALVLREYEDLCNSIPNTKLFWNYTLLTKFVEYMAAGKPVISTKLKEVSKIIKIFNCGLIANNWDEFKECIRTLYYNRNLAMELGEKWSSSG